ncbi:MAG: alpha-N-acetylglucosaminidase C-terminal domain-containing protein [Armatimonadetes bacterium]|nr:alpha-N-acetylglucosaminidase C-terminal domain-containing protein [Armatimonadota bacterium]
MYKEVLDDPNAVNCAGTSIMPEIVNHNPIYWDLLLKATWNPKGLTVDRHLRDVALRRYGSVSASSMNRALRKLQESVYGPYDMQATWPHAPRPMYRRRLTDLSQEVEQYRKRFPFIPKLRQAVEIMLGEADNQGNNKLYNNDLADVCNQYVSELINYNVVRMYDAFISRDDARFEECVRAIDKCFDCN